MTAGRLARILAPTAFALGLAACHGSSKSSAPSTASSTVASTVPTTATTSTTSTPVGTTTTAAPHVALCSTSRLTVTLPAGSGAAGTEFYRIAFENDGPSPCELTGYPGVSFLDASRAQIGVPAQRTGSIFSPVVIVPHGAAFAVLAVGNPDVRACPAATARYVRIFPPNNTVAAVITVDASNASGATDGIRVCAQQMPPATIDQMLGHA